MLLLASQSRSLSQAGEKAPAHTTTSQQVVRPRRTAPRSTPPSSSVVVVEETLVSDNNMSMSAGSFESLKREAVHLERQLEDKISRFQQVGLCVNITESCARFSTALSVSKERESKIILAQSMPPHVWMIFVLLKVVEFLKTAENDQTLGDWRELAILLLPSVALGGTGRLLCFVRAFVTSFFGYGKSILSIPFSALLCPALFSLIPMFDKTLETHNTAVRRTSYIANAKMERRSAQYRTQSLPCRAGRHANRHQRRYGIPATRDLPLVWTAARLDSQPLGACCCYSQPTCGQQSVPRNSTRLASRLRQVLVGDETS